MFSNCTPITKHMKYFIAAFISLLVVTGQGFAQDESGLRQTVKGTVVTIVGQQPVIGATVVLVGTTKGAKVKEDGTFRIKQVPPGRYVIKTSAAGYVAVTQEIVVTSGKQVILSIELQEKIAKGEEVIVSAKGVAIRHSGVPSARSSASRPSASIRARVGSRNASIGWRSGIVTALAFART